MEPTGPQEPGLAESAPADSTATSAADVSSPAPSGPAKTGGRDVGPFRGVTTVRVHGGYEICRGKDEQGRSVTILTMGPSAATDQALRATLAEMYEWARVTGGSGQAEFVGADLTGVQPWIASLDAIRPAGVQRLFERLVSSVRPPAPGRHTGSIPKVTDTGQIPRITESSGGPPAPAHRPDARPRPAGPPPTGVPVAGRVNAAPFPSSPPRRTAGAGHRANGPHTGQLPRVVESPTGSYALPTPPVVPPHAAPTPMPHQWPTHELPSPPPPPPMPAYQGRTYTAAPRPIAPPPGSGIRVVRGGRALPIMLGILGLIAIGVLALLVAVYVLLFR